MRVLVAPDSFTGSMSAQRAAAAISEGWQRTAPGDQLVLQPLSDGGPGFLATMGAAKGGSLRPIDTTGPWGSAVRAELLLVPDAEAGPTAYIEVAQTVGTAASGRGMAVTATSFGLAAVIHKALDEGAARIVVGLGGSLTTDGGAGLLAGLGATAKDHNGTDVTQFLQLGGAKLESVAEVDLEPARRLLSRIDLVIASDVDNPLLGSRGAARGFGPQKGADPNDVELLELSLTALAHACGRLPDGRSPALALGAGAAGGIGFALLHLGARRVSGIEWVLDTIGFASLASSSDLVVTGEGSFDWQSLRGKVISGVCEEAMRHGLPVVVLAGRVEVGRREWMAIGVSGAHAIVGETGESTGPGAANAMADGPVLLAELAERVARTWSR